jgi:hypothetical protein
MPNLWRGESDAEIVAALEAGWPSLRLAVGDGQRVIKGAFNVEHEGRFLAGFQIEILLDVKDVLGLPTVKEVGGRIPRVPERHINSADGSACLYLPEDLAVRCREPFDILGFLNGPVRAYFLGQAGVELGVPFPLGEWGHGAEGMKQLLTELLGFDDITTCIKVLDALSGKVVKGHWSCPCGSNRKLRDCHESHIRRLHGQLTRSTARFLAERARVHFPGKSRVEKRPVIRP